MYQGGSAGGSAGGGYGAEGAGQYASRPPGYTNGPSIGELIYQYRRQYPGLPWGGLGSDDTENMQGYQQFEKANPNIGPNTLPGYNGPGTLQRLSDTTQWVRGLGAQGRPGGMAPPMQRQGAAMTRPESPMLRLMRARFGGRNPFGGPGPMTPGDTEL